MFKTNKIVVLIGGGPVARTIPNLIKGLPIVAVDGGLDSCINYSMVPNYFIGDMDSASSSAKQYAKLNKIPSNFVAEQETTDFEKALMYVDAAGYVCLGFLDGRLDHSLAVLHVIQKQSQKRPILLLGSEDVVLTGPNDFCISLPVGERVSIWPLGKVSFEYSTGLLYSLKNIKMVQGKPNWDV
ncbi:MAG: thiamine pyrophosphokinase [Alphaproteobacteria bacterium]|nr:MAG: thiamine pyrophosphokinase [Alphaproteobacteria bacterium]